MQTILMTVGTSLLTNRDVDQNEKRPWLGAKTIDDRQAAVDWMLQKVNERMDWLEQFSAETNTFWRLDLDLTDELILLHSDTPIGLECAEVLRDFFERGIGQQNIQLHALPGVNYDAEQSESALEAMAKLLIKLIEQAPGNIVLAATGGFKSQAMIMGIISHGYGIPICYVHEQYRTLITLPYLQLGQAPIQSRKDSASIPVSSRDRADVIQVQESKKHHRPKAWKKVEKMLQSIPWIEFVRFDEQAFSAPKNGVKRSRVRSLDKCHVFWLHLDESRDSRMAVSIETTGYTDEHEEQAFQELREKLGKVLS